MTISRFFSRPASLRIALAGVGLATLMLAACGKASDQANVPPAADPNGSASVQPSSAGAQAATAAAGGLVVAAPTDVKAPPAGTVVPQDPNAAAEANADNAKVAELAKKFEADPAAVAQQNTACGPADQVVNNLYAVSHGAETDELHRFRVACMAKDDAQRELAKHAASAGGGVKNSGSL